MINISMLFLQQLPLETNTFFDKYIWVLVILLLTNGIQFFLNRKKNDSDITKTNTETSNLDAQTVASLIGSIKEIQNLYKEAFKTIQEMGKEQKLLEENLEVSQTKLEECLDKNADCQECVDILKEIKNSLNNLDYFVYNSHSNIEISEKIKTLMAEIDRKIQ